MALIRKLVCLAAAGVLMLMSPGAKAAESVFSSDTFLCLTFVNGLGGNSAGRMQSTIARLWILGYLAGYYKGKDTLEFSADPADAATMDALMVQKCKEAPGGSILNVALSTIANEPHKLPELVLGDFKPGTYTCGQHVDAKNGPASKANAADLAEMWAFAFIQGVKNVTQPDVAIQPEFRVPLANSLNKACEGSRDKLFLDMAVLVAGRTKIAK